MKRFIALTTALVLLIFIVGCSQTPADPDSDPSTDVPAEPSAAAESGAADNPQPTPGTEDTVTVDPTEAETAPPRQDGMRLSSDQLDYFNALFRVRGSETFDRPYHSYYNLALTRSFASAQDISLSTFFSLGFSNEWSKPITDAERTYYAKALGYDEFTLDMQRLPKALVDYVLDYYFCEEMDMSASGLVYNPDTQCYYWGGSDTAIYPNVTFTDGYFDEATGLVSLYYTHVYLGEEFIMTIQSKQSLGEAGYYIISNLPVA